MTFTAAYYDNLIRLQTDQRSQQLLLDVSNLKTLFLKLPVLEEPSSGSMAEAKAVGRGQRCTVKVVKKVQKQFGKIETLL
jgi:hypothetical protein